MGGESDDKLNMSRFNFTSEGRFKFTVFGWRGGRKMFQDEPETKGSHDHRGCILFNSQCDTHSLPVIMWSIKQTPFDLMAHSRRGFVPRLLSAPPVYPGRDGSETVTDPALWLRVTLS